MTSYRFDHLGLLCQDLGASRAFYRDLLGHDEVAAVDLPELGRMQILSAGADVHIGLMGAPTTPQHQAILAHNGFGLSHLAFATDDVAGAFETLVRNGAEPAWAPQAYEFGTCAAVFGPRKLLFVLLPMGGTGVADRGVATSTPEFLFNHSGILHRGWRELEVFLVEHFGLKRTYQFTNGSSGWVMLADAFLDDDRHLFTFEVLSPPNICAADREVYERRGSCIHHLAYIVADMPGAFQRIADTGVPCAQEPSFVDKWGMWLGFLHDPDGNCIELFNYVGPHFPFIHDDPTENQYVDVWGASDRA